MFDDFLVLVFVSNFRTNLWSDPDPDQGILAIYSNPDLNILYPDGLKRIWPISDPQHGQILIIMF